MQFFLGEKALSSQLFSHIDFHLFRFQPDVVFKVTFILIVFPSLYAWIIWHKNGLRDIPGPRLARFSNIYRFIRMLEADVHSRDINLHKRYGDIVRLGPNMVSVGDPSHIRAIYGIGANLPKVCAESCFFFL